MGGKQGLLTTDVVENNIPLLLSRRSMKWVGMMLDFGRDSVRANGRDIRLKITNTGHYALPLSLWLNKKDHEIIMMASVVEKRKNILQKNYIDNFATLLQKS